MLNLRTQIEVLDVEIHIINQVLNNLTKLEIDPKLPKAVIWINTKSVILLLNNNIG
jgi:hypothetical protein